MKTLIHHVQANIDIKKYSGFNVVQRDVQLNQGNVLKLWTLTSRVSNFPVKFGDHENMTYIVPKCLFAKRIAQHFHDKYHRDVDTTVTMIRAHYWITGLRRIVTNIDVNCKQCAITRNKVASQLMGALPVYRSQPNSPFSVTTMDLFGPLVIKDSVVKRGARVQKKVWGVLFTCASCRAVYLDISEDYSTQSVLHCLRRLMADRGQVKLLISDPGTQLKGAASELAEVREGWDDDELVRLGASVGVQWQFTMAASAHQNGVTEILVKMVKGVMKSLMKAIGTTVLFLNEMFTVFKETAQLVNERPIGLKPNRATDNEYLSPNSLLLGRCSDRISAGPFQSKASFDNDPHSDKTRYLLVQKIVNQFWTVWTKQYFPTLLVRQKWNTKQRNFQIGDICSMKDPNAMRGEWRMCRVKEVYPDSDGVVRNVMVTVSPPSHTTGSRDYAKNFAKIHMKRHVSNLILLEEATNPEIGHGEDCQLVNSAGTSSTTSDDQTKVAAVTTQFVLPFSQ